MKFKSILTLLLVCLGFGVIICVAENCPDGTEEKECSCCTAGFCGEGAKCAKCETCTCEGCGGCKNNECWNFCHCEECLVCAKCRRHVCTKGLGREISLEYDEDRQIIDTEYLTTGTWTGTGPTQTRESEVEFTYEVWYHPYGLAQEDSNCDGKWDTSERVSVDFQSFKLSGTFSYTGTLTESRANPDYVSPEP